MKNHFIILEKGSAIPLFAFFIRDGKDLQNSVDSLTKSLGDGAKRVLVTGCFNDVVFGGQFSEFIDFAKQFKDTKGKEEKNGQKEKDN